MTRHPAASADRRGELLYDLAMTFRGHMNAVRLPQPAAKRRLDQAIGFDGPDAAGLQLPADLRPVCRGGREVHSLRGIVAGDLENDDLRSLRYRAR